MFSARLAAALALLLCLTNGAAAADNDTWARNDLEKLLVAGVNDPSQRTAVFRALLTGSLCALTDKEVPEDAGHTDRNASFPILGVKAPDGQPAIPVFTAPARATETFGAKVFVICLNGAVLLSKVRGQRVVLNPNQPFGIVWSADDLDHLLGVARTASLTGVQFTSPDPPPTALIARLTDALSAVSEIKAAWLALAYWPDQKEWAWFLEIHTNVVHKPIEDLIDTATRGVDMHNLPMDTSFMPPEAPPGKGIKLLDR